MHIQFTIVFAKEPMSSLPEFSPGNEVKSRVNTKISRHPGLAKKPLRINLPGLFFAWTAVDKATPLLTEVIC